MFRNKAAEKAWILSVRDKREDKMREDKMREDGKRDVLCRKTLKAHLPDCQFVMKIYLFLSAILCPLGIHRYPLLFYIWCGVTLVLFVFFHIRLYKEGKLQSAQYIAIALFLLWFVLGLFIYIAPTDLALAPLVCVYLVGMPVMFLAVLWLGFSHKF